MPEGSALGSAAATRRRRVGKLVLRALQVSAVLGILSSLACSRASEDGQVGQPRVFLLGLDGASWKVIGPLIEAGELPNFARLTREGAYMPEFGTLDTTSSPVVWTTVATGRAPFDHGVQDYVEILPGGDQIPVTSRSRKAKAIWELASEQELSVGVVGWWASWPAEQVRGYVVSDHASPAFSEYQAEGGGYWTADREVLSALQRDYYPADLAEVLSRHWIDKAQFDYAAMGRRAGLTSSQLDYIEAVGWNQRSVHSLFKTFYLIDQPLVQATRELYRERPTTLTMLYLRAADPVQHYGWNLFEPERYFYAPSYLERDRGLVESVYRYVDVFLGEILADLGDDTWLIVASDHGSEPQAGSDREGFRGRPGGHTTAAKGVLFIRGPQVIPGRVLERGDPGDLMPTMAWLLGLPLSQELVGRELSEAFEPEFVRSLPRLDVASYGERPARQGMPSPKDEAMLESLRALGYIE